MLITGTDGKVYVVEPTDEDAINPIPVSIDSDIEVGAVEIKDADSEDRAEVTWDGTFLALNVYDSRFTQEIDDGILADDLQRITNLNLNYGYLNSAGYWTRFLTDIDDGDIAAGQTPQLVNGLMYYYEDKSASWKRWEGEGGSMWTTLYGAYTIMGDSILDDTANAMKSIAVDNTGTYLDLATAIKQLPDGHNVVVTSAPTTAVTGDFYQVTQPVSGDFYQVTQPVSGTVTANAGTNLNTSSLALDATLTDKTQVTKITNGTDIACLHNNMLCTVNDGHLISAGLITNHKSWAKIAYNPVITNTEETIWSAGGSYAFSKGEAMLAVVSDDAGDNDTGTILSSGTSTSGSTTTLIDSGADFVTDAVFAGDSIVLDKSGTTPEWGKITARVDLHTLTIANGFSSGGTGDTRDYNILDYSGNTGAQAVFVKYLDADFEEHDEIVILNGDTPVNTINSDYYRINGFRIVCAGSHSKAIGNILISELGGTPVYGHITAGYTDTRQAVFTVPLAKTLFINSFNAAWCSPDEIKFQTARIILRANIEKRNSFNMGTIFFPYIEVMVSNENVQIANDIPFKIPAKTDVIVSGISSNASGTGPATIVMRGWIDSE